MSAVENEPSSAGAHALLVVLFLVHLVLLAWIVLWKLEAPHAGGGGLREIKLVPFVPAGGAGASAPREVVANVVLFVPFGLYLGLLAPSWPWWRVAYTVAAASLVLEAAQYALAVGSSDVTDLLTNTLGGLAGLGLLALARRRFHARTTGVMARVCAAGTVLVLVAAAVVVASPLHYAPRDDGSGSSRPSSGGTARLRG